MDEIEKHRGMHLETLAPTGSQALAQEQLLDVSPDEVPHLLDYWQVVLKRRWTVLACFFIVFATVAIGRLKMTNVYEARVEMESNTEEPQGLKLKEINHAATTADVVSYREIHNKVLRSRTLA